MNDAKFTSPDRHTCARTSHWKNDPSIDLIHARIRVAVIVAVRRDGPSLRRPRYFATAVEQDLHRVTFQPLT
jgi:hypothetical protein